MAEQMQSILGTFLGTVDVPPQPKIDFMAEIQKSISDALKNLPQIETIASQINSFTADQLAQQRERLTPGITALMAKGTGALNDMIAGNLPQGVQEALHRDVLEKGAGLGISGSSFEKFSDISTSAQARLAYSQAGLTGIERWTQMAQASTPLFDIGRYMPTPGQYAEVAKFNEENRFSHDWLANQVKWAGSWQHAVQGLLNWVATEGAQVVSSYAGMAGGGGGMGGGGGFGGGGGSAYQGQGITPTMYSAGSAQLGG
jgi:hypothetical protein